MNMWRPHLRGDLVSLRPMVEGDFEALHQAASDPLIWEQHPEPLRYKLENFRRFFDGGLTAAGAFVVVDNVSGAVIGTSRFTNFSAEHSSVEIGFTFLARAFWGRKYNQELKSLMLAHAFRHVATAYFVIGEKNARSRRAIEKIGGSLIVDTAGLPLDGIRPGVVVYSISKRS